MPNEVKRFYWDSCLFLDYIEDTPERAGVVEAILDDAENGRCTIFTSILTITEVAFAKVERDKKVLDLSTEEKINRLWLPGSPIEIVEFHLKIAEESKFLMREGVPKNWVLKPNDAIHLATAKSLGIHEFHTFDTSLKKYSEVAGFRIGQPVTDKFTFENGNEPSG